MEDPVFSKCKVHGIKHPSTSECPGCKADNGYGVAAKEAKEFIEEHKLFERPVLFLMVLAELIGNKLTGRI